MELEDLDIHMQKEIINLDPYIIRCTKLNLKCIINPNVKTKNRLIKLPEENTGENLCSSGAGKDVFDRMQKA